MPDRPTLPDPLLSTPFRVGFGCGHRVLFTPLSGTACDRGAVRAAKGLIDVMICPTCQAARPRKGTATRVR